eukprot:RCo011913
MLFVMATLAVTTVVVLFTILGVAWIVLPNSPTAVQQPQAARDKRNAAVHCVAVTGASGYLAGHVVSALLTRGYTVRGTVRTLKDPSRTAHLRAMAAKLPSGRLRLYEADLLRNRSFEAVFQGCPWVVHTASPFQPKARRYAERRGGKEWRFRGVAHN